jgi:hypothetical protein
LRMNIAHGSAQSKQQKKVAALKIKRKPDDQKAGQHRIRLLYLF